MDHVEQRFAANKPDVAGAPESQRDCRRVSASISTWEPSARAISRRCPGLVVQVGPVNARVARPAITAPAGRALVAICAAPTCLCARRTESAFATKA